MKKILIYLLLLCSVSTFAQAEFPEGIQVTNVQDASALKVNVQNATGVINWKYLADFQKEKAVLSTGLIKNGLISANGDPTKFNITSGIGIISNFDDPENPISTLVNFPAFTGITPSYLLTGTITYVAINNAAAIVMQATPFTPEQRRSLIVLGAVVHSNLSTINVLNNISAPSNAGINQLHDFIEAVGALNLTGNKYTANGANLQLNKSAGTIFKLGVNFANDWKNPHTLGQSIMSSLTFRYRTQNGAEGSDRINLDPALYDNNNVLTAVPNNKFTIQTVTMFQSGLTRIQYGQTIYDDLATAKNAVFTRNFVLEPNSKENGIIRAYIIMRNTTTSLQTVADVEILEAQKFGGVASGGVALTLANIVTALGYTPENVSNKQNSLTPDGTGIKYPTVDAVNAGLALKANLASPTFTGTPTAPTATAGTNTTQIATTEFVVNGYRYKKIVYEGDSITAFAASPSYATTNYPTQIINYNSDVSKASQINLATSGQRLATFISNGDYVSQVQPHKPTSSKEKVLFSLMIGCNDLGDGTSAATVYNDLKTVWAQAKADGFTVVAIGVTRSTVSLRDTGALALNTLIYSDPTLYDYTVKTEVILPNPADLTYFESDGIHLNSTGSKKLAQELNEVLSHQINGYNNSEVSLSVINGKTDLQAVFATSIIKKGATSTDALLAGGSTLPNPVGTTGTLITNYIPKITGINTINNSRMAENATDLDIDSKVNIKGAVNTGTFNIFTGSTVSYNLAGQSMGSFSFGNASGTANLPYMIGKSADNRGMFLIAASPDSNSTFDFDFNIRRNTDADYSILTGSGYNWGRHNTQLMNLSRGGVLKINSLAGTGPAQVLTDANGNISRSVGYKVLTGLVTQTGTGAPSVTVLDNTLGGTVVWTRTSTGIYVGTLSGSFTSNKTTVSVFNGAAAAKNIGAYSDSVNTILIGTVNSATSTSEDDVLFKATIEIRVYN